MGTNVKFSKEKELEIIRLYIEEQKSQKEIADIYLTYNTSIKRVLERNNIAIRSNKEIQRVIKLKDIQLKENTPEFDYFIGILASDGCITDNKVILDFAEQDREILTYWNEFLGNKCNINISYHSIYNTPQYRISFRNKDICDYYEQFGITSKKSLNLQLSFINSHVLRGIFDGDGSVFNETGSDRLRVSITSGCHKFLLQLQTYLNENNISCTIVSSSRPKKDGELSIVYNLSIFKQIEIFNFYKLIYKDASYFLKRKYEKFGPLVEKFTKLVTVNSGKEDCEPIIPSQAL